MGTPVDQVLAWLVLALTFARALWLLLRPAHHTRASVAQTQVRVDAWLASHAQPRA